MNYCNACGKELGKVEKDGSEKEVVGMSVIVLDSDDLDEKRYRMRQMGKYELDKRYRICYECFLNALGVTP